ncbi:MAG: hypothetical protein ACPG66_09690 [Flavobacteriales bacterium]
MQNRKKAHVDIANLIDTDGVDSESDCCVPAPLSPLLSAAQKRAEHTRDKAEGIRRLFHRVQNDAKHAENLARIEFHVNKLIFHRKKKKELDRKNSDLRRLAVHGLTEEHEDTLPRVPPSPVSLYAQCERHWCPAADHSFLDVYPIVCPDHLLKEVKALAELPESTCKEDIERNVKKLRSLNDRLERARAIHENHTAESDHLNHQTSRLLRDV